MRLTGGLDRGRKLKAPRGLQTRPTAAKVRQAIFNILGPAPDQPILDLFAGTGALGLEALSRGAPRAVFVEREGRAVASLYKNLEATGLINRARIMACDVRSALEKLQRRIDLANLEAGPFSTTEGSDKHDGGSGSEAPLSSFSGRFAWIFVDPPYAADLIEETLGGIGCDLLASGGVVVVEHDKRHEPPPDCGGLIRTDLRYYGDTGLSFYRCHRSLA